MGSILAERNKHFFVFQLAKQEQQQVENSQNESLLKCVLNKLINSFVFRIMLHIITGMYPINMPLNMFQIYMSGLKQNMHKLCRQNFRVGQIVLTSMSRDRKAY